MSLISLETVTRRARGPRLKSRPVSPIVASLVDRRYALGMIQADVAQRMKRPTPMISDWERGRQDPSLRNLENWCAALGLKLCAEPTA